MFIGVLAYTGDGDELITDSQRVTIAKMLLHHGLQRSELKDELYMQLLKQTRGNPDVSKRARAWELFFLAASTMPPSNDYLGLI